MPGANGFQVTRAIARDPELADVPIIICSSKNQETDRIWGMRQGARGLPGQAGRSGAAAGADRQRSAPDADERAARPTAPAPARPTRPAAAPACASTRSSCSSACRRRAPAAARASASWACMIGAERYLLDLTQAGEIVPLAPLRAVPLTQPWYLGLANIRGNLVGVIDLARYLGAGDTAAGAGQPRRDLRRRPRLQLRPAGRRACTACARPPAWKRPATACATPTATNGRRSTWPHWCRTRASCTSRIGLNQHVNN